MGFEFPATTDFFHCMGAKLEPVTGDPIEM